MVDHSNRSFHRGPAGRIMMVITSLGFGGADTQVVNIARLLRSRGREVAVVSLVPPVAHLETLAESGIAVYSLEMRRRIPDPRAIKRLARIIQLWKPDVVHSHMVHANLLTRVTRCFVRMPALVCTAHNTRESSERGGPTWHKELLYRLTDRLADRTTIICQAGFHHYVDRKAVPPKRLQVVPIGVDCNHFSPNPESRVSARGELGITDRCFTFLAVGRMVVQKDYPNLLQAASLLKPGPWTLLIAGNGPLRPELAELVQSLDLSGHVRFLGVKGDVRPWFQAADAFVMSSAVEGMPVVLLEAAACGLPAVVTDAGGNPEVVISGKTGFVVPKQNHVALSRAMEQMLSLPGERRAQFAREARARATTHFEIGNVVAQWESLYDRCLQARSRTSPWPSEVGLVSTSAAQADR